MKSLKQAIDKLISKYGYTDVLKGYRLISDWKLIVGEEIWKHTKPIRVDFNKLFLKVDSPVWRNELYIRKEEIINKINSFMGSIIIEEIIFK
ncbi:MAG: DUF721 domain-containing protein [Candidatus Marinimicrobia bacterium]|nr:DUF721 domain-containing protein [Candidatus Neomarinimicrobiota bacterium]